MQDFNRLMQKDIDAINRGDVEEMRRISVPTLTKAYLANTSDDELLALAILAQSHVDGNVPSFPGGKVLFQHMNHIAKLEKINNALALR